MSSKQKNQKNFITLDFSQSNQVNLWLDNISKLSTQSSLSLDFIKSEQFVIYRIFDKTSKQNIEQLRFYETKYNAQGEIGRGKLISFEDLTYGYFRSEIKTKDDIELLEFCKGMFPRYSDIVPFENKLGYMILKLLAETNRCFYKKETKPLKFINDVFDIQFFWEDIDGESIKLNSNLEGSFHIVPTKPVLIIDKNNNTVQAISPNIEAELLSNLLNSPSIPKENQSDIYEMLLRATNHLNIEKPKEYIKIEKVELPFEVVVQSDESTDWFGLSFDIEIDGKTQPLVPIVESLIEQFEEFENLPKTIDVEIENNRYIKINTQTLKPILKTIFELFEQIGENDKLIIKKRDTHLVENIEQNVKWKGSKQILELSKKLKNFEAIETVNPSKCLNATLRGYQTDGLNWLNFLYQFKFNGILADDMGLGKTLQTLAHLSRLKEQNLLNKPSLIIMPTSLIANWKNEIAKFTPNLSVLSLYGSDRKKRFNDVRKYDIILSTYPLIVRDIEFFMNQDFCYIILDEAQKIKNPKTKMTMAIKELKSEYRLALSGTPIENHLGELWSIFDFLMPGFLDTQSFFKNYYQIPIEKENDKQREELLNKRVKPFMIRRTKEVVAHELPAKSEIIKYTQFDTKQSKLYESIRVSMEKKVREAVSKKGIGSSHITILDALLKLRQVCCDPRLLKIDEAKKVQESAKLELFLDLVDELLQEGRKILVFSQFTSMLKIIEDKIKEKKVKYTKLTGSTTNREEVINKFTSGKADMFLISLKSGGVGLNLVEADTVIHYDPWWNPAVENQATDRAYRIGQTKAVFVYKLIIENSIEQKILELQNRKKAIQDSVYETKDDENINFSGTDLLELLK